MAEYKITAVPLLDLKAQYATIREEIEPVVKDLIESQYFILGPKVKEFEQHVAEYVHAKYALGVSSGTDALLLALMALGVGPGDEVITTTYSFFATAGCISRLDAVPVFVDIEPDTYNIDVQKIEERITDKTKVIIPVHLYGQAAEMGPIMDLAKKYNLKVIEDGAQAIGTEDSDGRRVGSIGDISCFSFFPSKNLGGFGDGGMVTTNDDDLFQMMTYMRNHGAHPKYYHKMIGGNFRLDAIQGAVLDVKLKHLDDWTRGRQENAVYYEAQFTSQDLEKYVKVPFRKQGGRHIFNQYVIKVKDRDDLQKYMKSKNIGCEVYYPVTFNNQECFSYLGYKKGDFPVAEQAAAKTLAIPIYPELTKVQQDYVVTAIAEFFK